MKHIAFFAQRVLRLTVTVACLGALSLAGCSERAGDDKPAASSKGGSPARLSADKKYDYLAVVQRYADTMIVHGRDVYGPERTPLFAVCLDRLTLRIPEGARQEELLAIPHADWGIRPHDRMIQGANPMQDQNLYRTLYALSEITENERFAAEADKALKWFFEHCQSPSTGLFAWGEHIGWDFTSEKIIDKESGTLHEFARPWTLWDRSFSLSPEPCRRFALGLWEHQIADHEQCLFSRHARYDDHGPGTGSEYPRHGGFYIATWASAYEYTGDTVFLEAIGKLVDSFERRRNPVTGALMAETQSPELMWPNSNLSLAVDLWDSAEKVPPSLAQKMRACASKTDEVFLKIKQDLTPGGKGFMIHAVTSTLEPGWMRLGKPDDTRRHFTDTWATAYGEPTDAQVAMLCYIRYTQVGLNGYWKLAYDAAGRYLASDPDTTIALTPGALGDAIALLLTAYRMTDDQRYLARADHFGRMAVDIFFDDSPLPRASSRHDHYEAITRSDTLALNLLLLWAALHRDRLPEGSPFREPVPAGKTRLVFNER
jgi:hypothetical protein